MATNPTPTPSTSGLSTAAGIVTEIQTVAGEILTTLESLDPALAPAAAVADGLVTLFGTLVSKALAAYSAATGIAITAESVAALSANPTPLTPPTA